MKKQTTVKTLLSVLAASMVFPAVAAEPAPEAAKPAAAVQQEAAKAPVTMESVLSFLPDVLAEVGGEKITKAQLIKQLSQAQVTPEVLTQFPKEVLKGLLAQQILPEMVNTAVVLAMAKKAGIEPSEKLVKEGMDKFYAKMDDAQKSALEKNLQAHGKTYASYRDEMAADPEFAKSFACNMFLESAVVSKVKDPVTDADAEKFYREHPELFEKPAMVTVSHILALGPDAEQQPLTAEARAEKDKAAKDKIERIYARLKQGEKFEDLAEKESECPSGKRDHGKLPAFTQEGRMGNGQAMEKTFTEASFKLEKVGEISEVVKTPFGYHIIRLEGKTPQQLVPFAEVKEAIRAQMAGEKIDRAVRAALEQGKKDLGVKVFLTPPELPAPAVAVPEAAESGAPAAAPAVAVPPAPAK